MIVAGRILLLVVATGAVLTAFLMSRKHDRESIAAGVMYVCPMHAEIRSSSRDRDCPICGMALKPTTYDAPPVSSTSRTAGSPWRDGEPDSFVLPTGAELRSSHGVARTRVRVGSRPIRAPAWFEGQLSGSALFYRDDAAALAPDEQAVFFPAAALDGRARDGVKLRLAADAPIRWDNATALVRFRVESKAARLPNETGWLELAPRIRREIVVPYSAVLQSPVGPYLLVLGADNRTITKRPIEVGSVFSGDASVISGAAAGERVATMTTFSLDAERRLRRRSVP